MMPQQPPTPAAPDPSALLLHFLAWVAARPRGYAETMAAWRTSCPRLQVWEDATAEGLVRLEAGIGATQGETRIALTAAGLAALATAARAEIGR
jgi:hypothetical protein